MPMELTKEQKKEYVDRGGIKCPYCGDDDISGGHITIDVGYASQRISCVACEKKWIDLYRLVDVVEDQ